MNPTGCPRCAALEAERDAWQAAYRTERDRRTLGGTPLRVGETWTNQALGTPEAGAGLPELKPHTVEGSTT